MDESWNNPVELIAWSAIGEIATSIPATVRGQLEAFVTRWREHQRAYPRFVTSSPAPSCAEDARPNWREGYERDLRAFETSGVLPRWKARQAELEAERLDLHPRALAIDPDAQATDLLELLEEQALPTSGPTAGAVGPDPTRADRPALPPHVLPGGSAAPASEAERRVPLAGPTDAPSGRGGRGR